MENTTHDYNNEMRICSKCKETKLLEDFAKRSGSSSVHNKIRSICRQCYQLHARTWPSRRSEAKRIANKNRKKVYRHHIKVQGVGHERFQAMLDAQNGVCAVCGNTNGKRQLCVDHCHATGKVRGLLCGNCNLALGNLKDDPQRIANLLAYILKYV